MNGFEEELETEEGVDSCSAVVDSCLEGDTRRLGEEPDGGGADVGAEVPDKVV